MVGSSAKLVHGICSAFDVFESIEDYEQRTTLPIVHLDEFCVKSSPLLCQDGVAGKEARCPSQQGEVS